MANTIDHIADDPSDTPFGGATRVLSNNELNGLLAEDARNAPATIAHPAVVRRSSRSDVTSPPEEEMLVVVEPFIDEPVVGEPVTAEPVLAEPVLADPVLPVAPASRTGRVRILWVTLFVVALGAAAFELARALTAT